MVSYSYILFIKEWNLVFEKVGNEILFFTLHFLNINTLEDTQKISTKCFLLIVPVGFKRASFAFLQWAFLALMTFKEILESSIKLNTPRTNEWCCLIIDLNKLVNLTVCWTNLLFKPILFENNFLFIIDWRIIVTHCESHLREWTKGRSLQLINNMVDVFHGFEFIFALLYDVADYQLKLADYERLLKFKVYLNVIQGSA